ncbi:PepSY domain-containing protein [Saccharibacillus sp. O23]|uniref:PepSY domain-containing protein n=1 Tax=Saccharibacillus sp. O23 TaxID=2009338 RepID=UPI0015C5ABF9|nr:PepSY domain-containing protein [Saccharibacillus sp. O23]
MTKRKLMIGAVAAALTLGGTAALAGAAGTTGTTNGTTAQSVSKAMISQSQAEQIALKAQKGTVDEVELKTRNGKTYYEVDIDRPAGESDVDVWVDAYTGSLLKVEPDEDRDDRGGNASNSGQTSSAVKITSAQAASIAIEHAGGGKVTDNDLDKEDGVYVYEIEVKTANGETDVKIDANTGKVLKSETDYDDDDDDRDDD